MPIGFEVTRLLGELDADVAIVSPASIVPTEYELQQLVPGEDLPR